MKQCMGCMEIYQDNLTKCPICGYEEGTIPENTLHMEPGSILNNRYIIGKVLGYGGFGVTYIAWDTLLEQKVAIKEFLPSEFATRMLGRREITIFSGDKHKQFMEGLFKFVEEAKKIAKFNNVSGIVKIFDCIEENNTAYIIMEYLEGDTLATVLEKEKKMKPDKAIHLLLPIMDALKKVNANGIIHRDIAPDNIFITSKGEPKLIDFGAARYATTSLSRSLTIIIKPGYSPEEQYRSLGDQGSWTDVYSIAATLYKMITGETPCDSMERRAYMEQHHTDMLKPISKFVNIEKNQETAIMNALNVKIQDRTMNMAQLMEELTADGEVYRVQSSKESTNILMKIPFKAKIITIITMAVIVLGVMIASIFKDKEELVPKGMTRVPNIQNLNIESAMKLLDSKKLKYTIVGYKYSTSIPENSVMSQSIAAGTTVKIDSEVELTVSKYIDALEMNNITAMNWETAKELLEQSGYTVTVGESEYDDVIAKFCVIEQDLDKKNNDKAVTIRCSKGREEPYPDEESEIPGLVGKEFKECFKICKEAGFMIEVLERKASKEYADGVVMTQSIEEGTRKEKGETIQIVVSTGTGEIKLDDFTNWEVDRAVDFLSDQGIVVEEIYEVNENYEHGIVYGQSPAKGTTIKTGEKVTLNVSIGPEEFTMVSLKGKTQEEAERIAKSYGLDYEVVQGYSTEVEAGEAYDQSIPKGEKAKVGDKIVIKVSNPEAEYELPEMIGKNIDDIEKELTEMGLNVTAIPQYGSIPSKQIISATPNQGTKVKVGDSVNIVFSGGQGDIAAVANVKGMNYIQAESTLTAQGLKVNMKYEFNLTHGVGMVMAQSITEGSQASSGDEIELVVSKGMKPKVDFINNPLEIGKGYTHNIRIKVEPQGCIGSWDIKNPDIATVSIAQSPTMDEGDFTYHYANISTYNTGTTELIFKIKHIDDTYSTYKCKLKVQ